jgi:thiol-disulfide isomerase/thioredoxin
MTRTGLRVLLALSLGLAVAIPFSTRSGAQQEGQKKVERATIDKPIKDFKLRDLMKDLKDGEKEGDALIALSQFHKQKEEKDNKVVVLYFMSEHCGTTRMYDKRVGDLLKETTDKPVKVLGVRCSASDTPDGLRKWVEAKNFDISLLNDAKGAMTTYFKVRRTPTFAVIDQKGVLRYWGSFDDDANEESVTKTFVKDAVMALLEGKEVSVKENQPFG